MYRFSLYVVSLLCITISMFGITHAETGYVGFSRVKVPHNAGSGVNTLSQIAIHNSGSVLTGKAFCNNEVFVNYFLPGFIGSLARGAILYDTGEISILSGNRYVTGGNSYPRTIEFANALDIFQPTIPGQIFRLGIMRDSLNQGPLPMGWSIGRIGIVNTTGTQQTTIELYQDAAEDRSTLLNQSGPKPLGNIPHTMTMQFVAEPCIHDGPVYPSQTAAIDPGYENMYRVPSLMGTTLGINAGKPITTDSSRTNPIYHLPGMYTSFRSTLSGLRVQIKEPDPTLPTLAVYTPYAYTGLTSGHGTGVFIVTGNFVPENNVSNQRGIDALSLVVTLQATFTDPTNPFDTGTNYTLILSGSDLVLNPFGTSWNGNALGYTIDIPYATIVSGVIQQGGPSNAEYKRETAATLRWYARDLSNSMIIEHNTNNAGMYDLHDVNRTGRNEILNDNSNFFTGYTFNQFTDNPVLAMFVQGISLPANATGPTLNIPLQGSGLSFSATDIWAGIDSGSMIIAITGYRSSIKRRDNYITGNVNYITFTGVFSGSDLNLFSFFANGGDRPDYSGLITYLGLDTGMHYSIRYSASDFVGNTTQATYQFRTNAWPDKPYGINDPNTLEGYNTEPFPTFSILDYVKDIHAPGYGNPTAYNYSTLYPSHKALISGFYYKGSQFTGLILTGLNGGIGPVITMTGLFFDGTNGTGAFITGSVHVSGLTGVTDFPVTIIAENIYGITGEINFILRIYPTCGDSPGCIDKIHMYRGTSLDAALAMPVASGIWYNNWFVHILDSTGFFFSQSGISNSYTGVGLYCAGNPNTLTIQHTIPSGPDGPYVNRSMQFTGFSGTVLQTTGLQFVYDATGNTIYIIRPLTGQVNYNPTEFSGGEVNRSRVDYLTASIYISGGRINGTGLGTGNIHRGGGMRTYTAITGNNTSGQTYIPVINRIGTTGSIPYEVYWIDRVAPSVSVLMNNMTNISTDIVLSGINVGQLSNSMTSNLTGDDERKIDFFFGLSTPILSANGNLTGGSFIQSGALNNFRLVRTLTFFANRSGYVGISDRAGNTGLLFIQIHNVGGVTPHIINARMGFRMNNNYSVTGDFRMFYLSSGDWLPLYNSRNNPQQGTVRINSNGTGVAYFTPISTGTEILAVFKPLSTVGIAVGFTGTYTSGMTIDFTSGDNPSLFPRFLYGTSNFVIPGDSISNTSGGFDFLNGADLTEINNNLSLGTGLVRPYDLDVNEAVNAIDQSIVLQFINRYGYIYYIINDIGLSGFNISDFDSNF